MTAPTTTAPRRAEFRTRDPAEARAFLDTLYGVRLEVEAPRDASWLLGLRMVDAGLFSSIDIVLPAHLTFGLAGQDDLVIGTVTGGLIGFEWGQSTYRYAPGDVYISSDPRGDDIGYTREARALTTTLPQSLLTDVARGAGEPGPPWQFTAMQGTPSDAARWRATSRFVDDLLAEPATAASPLLLGPATRLLAATALTVFPNTLVTDAAPADSVDAHPGTLRRAVAFIDADCDRDISLADIARAAYVTPRAVQLAFRRYLDTTPTAYLRTARLAQAHQQLRDATPGDGLTVTAVAARWGFTPSRFTEHYRAAYGVLPSHTLRT
ncbi:AraC family transcriptional regulator [Blastococcus sp. TF02-09]|uniref:helix-turn-helix transcriptional regulator n=1 Tax=Blastococcus sp. TF02-09 TaxID=2250576 RepID=UPI000DEB6E90|nr:helix-turn-helix transcriptional regulator [Blastococcus sp. TF02-9]RBY77975.1 AraC family transcriptional regulator [Blastococcus sp. TF02-9]